MLERVIQRAVRLQDAAVSHFAVGGFVPTALFWPHQLTSCSPGGVVAVAI